MSGCRPVTSAIAVPNSIEPNSVLTNANRPTPSTRTAYAARVVSDLNPDARRGVVGMANNRPELQPARTSAFRHGQ